MTSKKLFANETDLQQADPQKTSKLNFGDGLQVRVHRNGHKYFQFRYCLEGQEKTQALGKYPEMSLAQAREKANHYRGLVVAARSKKAELTFRKNLKQQSSRNTSERYCCFKRMEDAIGFMRNLDARHFDTEIGRALWFQLLIPSRLNELIHAQRADFSISFLHWTISQKKVGPGNSVLAVRPIAYLSEYVATLLTKLTPSTMGDATYLYPELARMPMPLRNKIATEVMQDAWPNYQVDSEGFRDFFRAMANQHSYFRSELIEDMLAHKPPRKGTTLESSYILQRRALADWWRSELLVRALI